MDSEMGFASPPGGPPHHEAQRRAAQTVDQALEWLAGVGDEGPIFLWVHLYEPHQPYDPPEPFRTLFGPERGDRELSVPILPGSRILGGLPGGGGPPGEASARLQSRLLTDVEKARLDELYDGEVASADFQVGRLLARLRAAGLDRDLVVALLGDHGETLGEHEDYYGHHHVLYESSLRIPFLLRVPGRLGGRVEGRTACGADLAPTILPLLGLAAEPVADGVDLLQPAAAERPLFCENFLGVRQPKFPRELPPDSPRHAPPWGASRQALRSGGFKLLLSDAPGSTPVLFDLAADPGEREDAAARRPEVVEELLRQWRSWDGEHPLPRPERKQAAPPEVDEETRQQLRSLGYVE